ncbi:MAG: hypothetical protein LBM93_10065 [Oscillospiraceae bacterium]|jgi:hypothetical protein|nr:hypothetical protein [Oscillospiraceae bacterium]
MKKAEKFLNLIGEIDLKYVEDAENAVKKNKEIKALTVDNENIGQATNIQIKRFRWFLPVAACFILALASIAAVVNFSKDNNPISESPIPNSTNITENINSSTKIDNIVTNENTDTTISVSSTESSETEVSEEINLDLPKLDLNTSDVGDGIFIGKDISNKVGDNLFYTDDGRKTMPVYKPVIDFYGQVPISGLTEEEMTEILTAHLEILGAEVSEEDKNIVYVSQLLNTEPPQENEPPLEIKEERPYNITYRLSDTFTVSINITGTVYYTYETPTILDNKLSEMVMPEEVYAVSEELYQKYSGELESFMTNPQITTSFVGFEANYRSAQYSIMEMGEKSKKFSRAHLSKVSFLISSVIGEPEQARLSEVAFNYIITPESMGDYPIISIEDAKQQLIDIKHYEELELTLQDLDNAVATQLVYTTPYSNYGQPNGINSPYYCFWIKRENKGYDALNLNTYQAYYMPAVDMSYISSTSSFW